MLILNAGCGGSRPGHPFINLDCLRTQLKVGTPERANLDREDNYVEADILNPLPFLDDFFDGVCAIHVVEHLTCHEAAFFLSECRRVLKPGGVLLVSVPDAEYFLSVYGSDTKERAVELFGEPIHDPGFEKFFDYALFRYDHKQILTPNSLLCLMLRSGFVWDRIHDLKIVSHIFDVYPSMVEIYKQLSRRKFSLEMCAIK